MHRPANCVVSLFAFKRPQLYPFEYKETCCNSVESLNYDLFGLVFRFGLNSQFGRNIAAACRSNRSGLVKDECSVALVYIMYSMIFAIALAFVATVIILVLLLLRPPACLPPCLSACLPFRAFMHNDNKNPTEFILHNFRVVCNCLQCTQVAKTFAANNLCIYCATGKNRTRERTSEHE